MSIDHQRPTQPFSFLPAMNAAAGYDTAAERLRALADTDRLQLVAALLRGPLNVSDLSAAVGMSIVKVSHHLGVLRNAEVVLAEKRGKFVIYSLHPDVAAGAARYADPETGDLGCCRLPMVHSIAPRPRGE